MSDQAYENIKRNSSSGEIPDYIDPPLTEEEKRAVVEREDHGITEPVPQLQFKDLEHFIEDRNNFSAFFIEIDPDSPEQGYRTKRAYQRFELLYPELNQRLLDYKLGRQMDQWPQQAKEDLFDGYKKMAKLVDRQDVGIAVEINNGISESLLGEYLLR